MGVQPHQDRPALYRYRFGTAEFDEGRFELRVAGRVIDIQRRPLEVLDVFLRRAGELVTRNELEETVWRSRPTRAHVIHAALTRLRGALGQENAECIATVARVGYRFTGSVERIAVGRHFAGNLSLNESGVVSRREGFILASRLSQSPNLEVWLARHIKSGERRVYKFSADGEGLAALKREAAFARVLRKHSGERRDVVQLFDWNFTAPPFFLEYEYGGVSLLEWATEHLAGLAVEERVELFLQVTDAVAAAHSIGVVHGDLKPANLLVSQRAGGGWQVRLTDFGGARLLEPERLQGLGVTQRDAPITDDVMSEGMATLIYMAPERLTGGPATVQSDVFALGMLLYQLVAGDFRRPLVPGWERNVPDELLREDIGAAADGNPGFRLASVGALVDRLRRRGERREEQERVEGARRAAAEALEAVRRRRTRRPWILLALLFLALGLLFTFWLRSRANVGREHAVTVVSSGARVRSIPAEWVNPAEAEHSTSRMSFARA